MSDAYEMKISKLIELLQTAQSTYGDLPVTTGLGRLRGARVIVARDGNVWSVPNGAQNELKVELDEAAAEITRLRAQVAEQEAAIKRAVEAEREACAKVAELMPPMRDFSPAHVKATTPRDVATAIRNRTDGGE